ncbi:MAG: EAL domain-containing protein [Leptolyngbyaceae bacterium]|nr:EAL domain-containing protein [Leptolyngbyaceae bacterium]
MPEHVLELHDHTGDRQIVLKEATYSLGRWSSNSIVIESSEISRQHAILLRIAVPDSNDYVFRLVDGNLKGQPSTNGIFVNGSKKSSHILRHGDEISFGGQIRANYYCFLKPKSSDSSQSASDDERFDPFNTIMVEQPMTITETDAEMARLVSFLEMSPHPIIELDLKGHITYLNPASVVKFPNLKQLGTHHPILTDLVHLVQTREETSFVREIDLGETVHQQAIYYLPESQLIRLNMLDVTHKKQAEAEVLKRDTLLQAIAQATKTLLVELNFEKAIHTSLSILGQVAKIDTMFVCRDIADTVTDLPVDAQTESSNAPPTQNPIPIDFQYEYSTHEEYSVASIPCFKELLSHHYHTTNEDGANLWRSSLTQGLAVHAHQTLALGEPLSRSWSQSLNCIADDVKIEKSVSILLVPLFLNEQYWGFIGVVDWQGTRQWSSHEESSLFTLAAAIGAALNRKQTEEKMRHRALFDPLTELPNRSLFNEQLSFCLKNAQRNGNQLVVMFLDLDRFKLINDTLGHTLGDQLLKEAALRVAAVLRDGDMVARWGGDEFTILLPQIRHVTDAVDVAERILHMLEAAFEIEGHELYITGSIGITFLGEEKSGDDNADMEALIKHADIALYRAKEKGRNCYAVYNPLSDFKTPELLTLDKDMRRALIQEEFIVYYQPRVDITSNKIVSVEALVRWQHPGMGLVSPTIFIPLAEENGLIIPIGEWVLRQACLQTRQWQKEGIDFETVSVNLSPRQFRQLDLVARIETILKETGLDPQYLELEITESEAIHDIAYTVQVLEELHEMGVKVSVDDFGTGHSSLNRLQSLPFDNLKIDRSFVQDLMPGTKLSHIVSTIVALGRQLGMCIVAEGVEETEQLEFLQSIHCDTVQGYLFYKPMPAANMKAIFESE